MIRILYIIIVVSTLFACNNDSKVSNASKTSIESNKKDNPIKDKKTQDPRQLSSPLSNKAAKNEDGLVDMGNGLSIGTEYEFASYDLPSTCELLPSSWLSTTFNVDKELIQVKDASSSTTKYARSCFFKWEVESVANGGIMVQIQGNPVPKETKTWISGYIDSKRTEGETTMNDPDTRATYKDLPGLGDEAVYNYSLNRCFWRIGEDYLFMLAFNLGMTEAEEKAAALKIGKEVLKNFNKIKK